jgi:ABC-type transporter Mla MlaB component
MFKISIIEEHNLRKLMLEGRLVRPWTAEVDRVWRAAGENLEGRKLVVDLTNVTHIDTDGESTLFKLMRDGSKFSCRGVLTKHVLRQLARKCRCAT